MRNGIVCRQQPLVLRIYETEFSYWPTPNLPNGGRSIPADARWATLRTAYKSDGKKIQVGLESAVRRVSGPGPLNPLWTEWLMGFPAGWTGLGDSVMPWFPK